MSFDPNTFFQEKEGDPSRIFTERPKRPMQGRAMRVSDTTDSVISIQQWLASIGVTAYVAPTGKTTNAMVRIDTVFEQFTAFPGDYVFVHYDGAVEVISDRQFNNQYREGIPGAWVDGRNDFPYTDNKESN